MLNMAMHVAVVWVITMLVLIRLSAVSVDMSPSYTRRY